MNRHEGGLLYVDFFILRRGRIILQGLKEG